MRAPLMPAPLGWTRREAAGSEHSHISSGARMVRSGPQEPACWGSLEGSSGSSLAPAQSKLAGGGAAHEHYLGPAELAELLARHPFEYVGAAGFRCVGRICGGRYD